MNDPFEWQEYKDKVEELTRKLEELTTRVEEGSGEAEEEEGFSPLFSGNQPTAHSRQPIMHYAGHLGDDCSMEDYSNLRGKFEDFVKDSAAYLKPGVQQFDMITATMGVQRDHVYCLLTVEDGSFQSVGPAPYKPPTPEPPDDLPWNYHIWSPAPSGPPPCYCRSEDLEDATLSFATDVYDGLSWVNLPYEDCCCSYSGVTSPASGDYEDDKFVLTFSFDGAGRGWVATITCDNSSVDTSSLIYWGGGHVDDDDYDVSKDIMDCDADIPATVGIDTAGLLWGASSALQVT